MDGLVATRTFLAGEVPFDAGEFVSWLLAPTDWLGFHKILEFIPASVGVFLAGLILFLPLKILSIDLQDR